MGVNQSIENLEQLREEVFQQVHELSDRELASQLCLALTQVNADPWVYGLEPPSLSEAFSFMLEKGTDIDPVNVEELSTKPKEFVRRQELVREFSGRLALKVFGEEPSNEVRR